MLSPRVSVGMADERDLDPPHSSTDHRDGVPTVSCTRCGREWDLEYELEERHAGNQAVEQFALDHERHTGHFPDDVSPWVVNCRQCPEREAYLSERPARRWARTHARHTRHGVDIRAPDAESPTEVIERP